MQDDAPEHPKREPIAFLAAEQGLSRALALFPDAVRAAAERARRPMPPLPPGQSNAEPAFSFAPARVAQGE